jgi:hypothetical protein
VNLRNCSISQTDRACLTPVAAACRPASLVVVRDPFELMLDARQARCVDPFATLQDLAPAEPGAWLCLVDGQAIPRAQWHCMPRPGSVVVFRMLPQGGGGGSNPLRTILMIAVMVFAPYLAPALGLTGIAAQVVTTLTMVAGSALVNNLVPLDASNRGGSGGAQQFSAQAQGNLARIGQPVPEIMGFDHGWPDLAAQPYNLYEDNEQFLHLLFVVGRGQYALQRVSVGDTPITSFAEASVVRIGPGQATQSGPGSGIEDLADLTLVDPAWVTSQDVAAVEMATLDYVGPFAACRPEATVDRIGIDVVLPRGLDASRSITWRVESRTVDDFDAATSAWATLATETCSTDSVVPLRLSYEYAVTPGRHQVRLVRTDTRATSDGSAHDISWLALRGHLGDGFTIFGPEVGTPDLGDDVTFVAVKVRASGQLSGSLRFRVRALRMLPTWDGSAWTDPVATRNPAWAFARVLKSRATPDASIDLDQLLALATVWDARQDRFDYRFDSQISMWDALAMIARVGRAVPLIRGSRYTLVRDALETAPVALYGMRNIRRGTMRLRMALPEADAMTTLDLEYWDHRRWDWATVTAQVHGGTIYGYRGEANRPVGVPAPDDEERGRIKMPGIVGENHAIRTAVYTLADGYYRRMSVEYDTELDGLLPAPLSLVVFQHDVGNFGAGGDVADWDSTTRVLETTEPLPWEQGAQHYVRLMMPNGTLSTAIACEQSGGDTHAMVLDATSLAAAETAAGSAWEIVFDDAGRERTRYVFGPATSMGALAKVRAITPRSERVIGQRLVLEDDRVHTADNAWLPAGEQDPIGDGGTVAEGASDFIVNLVDITEITNVLGSVTMDLSIRVYNDGRVATGTAAGGSLTYRAAQWLNPQTVTPAIAGLYEVKFSVVLENSGGIGGDTLDTWLPLDTSRYVSFSNGAPALAYYAHVEISIREAATGIVQDTALYAFDIQDNSP